MTAKKRNFFEDVDLKVVFPKMEKEILNYWERKGILKKYLQKNKNSKKYFSFLDGPITANNPMGVHHAWGRTYKDLWQKLKNMQGYRQRFQNGFDSQGLWVEVEVEKELGFKNKKDIENFGVEKFVNLCKKRVEKYSKIQTDQSKRLGFFMDWEHSYYTLSDDNNYLIWHFLSICHKNGWLYKGSGSVPWCPRCETAISQHEILTEDYKELTHESIILEFPVVGKKDEYLLVWTTTPWTIPANIAIAVDSDLEYSLIQGTTGDKFWLATDTIERVFGDNIKPIKSVKGEALVGLTYKGPFDDLPKVERVAKENPDTFHKVVATDQRILPVSTEEGTGLVHTAVSAGTEDYKLGQKLALPMIPVIGDDATYLDGMGFLSGKNAKNDPRIILDYLVKEDKKPNINWVFDIFKYKHRYPVCWRCKKELVWKVTEEWYISMDRPSRKASDGKSHSHNASEGESIKLTLRQRMKKVARKIKWIPAFGLKRELDWLNNMQDWLISKKNRYWGLALPIWECNQCRHFEVFGSKEELKSKANEGWEEFEGKTPHKPQIDKIKIKCQKCGAIASRIEPVGNPWLDAGIVAFSTISEDNRAANFKKTNTQPLYLADKKKWRKWFPADFITESFPGQFKNWFYSLIAMSTVLENENPFKTVLGFATLLSEDGAPMHKSTGNMIEFNEAADKIGVDVARWIYARQNPSENLLFGYKLADEIRRKFHLKLWNVYNFFVTYANLDGWSPSKGDIQNSWIPTINTDLQKSKLKSSVLDKWILMRLDQLGESVTQSLGRYDSYKACTLFEEFLEDLSNWYIRRSRERVGSAKKSITDSNSFYKTTYFVLVHLVKLLAPFIPYITDEIYRKLTKKDSVHLDDWPESIITKDENLLDSMKIVRDIAEKAHSERKILNIPVKQPLSSLYVTGNIKKPEKDIIKLLMEEVNVKKIIWKKGRGISTKFDTKITQSLLEEAKSRELIRKIQHERKIMGLDLKIRSVVYTPWLPGDENLVEWIKTKTASSRLIKGKEFKIASK